eukprot:1157925-Pelagomonas_calceolata.AAC.8
MQHRRRMRFPAGGPCPNTRATRSSSSRVHSSGRGSSAAARMVCRRRGGVGRKDQGRGGRAFGEGGGGGGGFRGNGGDRVVRVGCCGLRSEARKSAVGMSADKAAP